MIGEVRRELMDPRIHSLVTMHVVYGQKPKEGVREEEVEESGLIEVDSEMGGMEPASGGEVGKGKGVEVSAGGPTAPA